MEDEGGVTILMQRHLRRLYWLHVAAGCLVAVVGLVGHLARPAGAPPLLQADAVLGVLVTLAAFNLLTLLPVRRAMLASSRRVFAVSTDAAPLLQAHLLAQATALVRGVALAALALAALYLAGRQDWFWILQSSAVLALLVLWPRRRAVEALLGISLDPAPRPRDTRRAPPT